MLCEHGYGRCTAPNTKCPHWIGIFCELDCELDVINNSVAKDCSKCIYKVECRRNLIDCIKYKSNTYNGGYYG